MLSKPIAVAFPPVAAHQPLNFTALANAGGFLVNFGSSSKSNDDKSSDDETVDLAAAAAATLGTSSANVNGDGTTARGGTATTAMANGTATATVMPATGLQHSQSQHATCVSCFHPGVLLEMTPECGKTWTVPNHELDVDLNGRLSCATWSIHDVFLSVHREGSDVDGGMLQLDFFFLVFLPRAVWHGIALTNVQFNQMEGQDKMDIEELMRFFGLSLLMTCIGFANHCDFWSLDGPSKHLPSPAFGRLCMSRNPFDAVWSCLWPPRLIPNRHTSSHALTHIL